MSPLFSIVRYEMHRRESITPGAIIAPVGQAVMHFVQFAHGEKSRLDGTRQVGKGSCGELVLRPSAWLLSSLVMKFVNCSGCPFKSSVVMISERKTHEPNSGVIRQAFLPNFPMPACSARARSRTGPVST